MNIWIKLFICLSMLLWIGTIKRIWKSPKTESAFEGIVFVASVLITGLGFAIIFEFVN